MHTMSNIQAISEAIFVFFLKTMKILTKSRHHWSSPTYEIAAGNNLHNKSQRKKKFVENSEPAQHSRKGKDK